MALSVNALTPLEQVYLGVLALGLPSSKLAGDEFLRVDYLAAVAYALVRDEAPRSYLQREGPQCATEFEDDLRLAVRSLAAKDVLALETPPAGMGMIALHDRSALLDQNQEADLAEPAFVLDRFLSQQCLEALLRNREAYSFLMGLYAQTSEVWQRLRAEGYADRPGP